MGKITKQHEDKVRSLIKSIKGGNDSAIEELFDLEKNIFYMRLKGIVYFGLIQTKFLIWQKLNLHLLQKNGIWIKSMSHP